MNRFIFDALTFLNGLLAIITIGACTFVGYNTPLMASARPVGALLGLGTGIVTASLLCGAIAFMALIEQHMRAIAEAKASVVPHQPSARREPSL